MKGDHSADAGLQEFLHLLFSIMNTTIKNVQIYKSDLQVSKNGRYKTFLLFYFDNLQERSLLRFMWKGISGL